MQTTFKKDLDEIRKTVTSLNSEVSKVVEEYPWVSVLAATAVGFGVAFMGIKKLSALALENKDLLNDLVANEFGIDFSKMMDIKKAVSPSTPASAIGA